MYATIFPKRNQNKALSQKEPPGIVVKETIKKANYKVFLEV